MVTPELMRTWVKPPFQRLAGNWGNLGNSPDALTLERWRATGEVE
jgi:hypothetical protein